MHGIRLTYKVLIISLLLKSLVVDLYAQQISFNDSTETSLIELEREKTKNNYFSRIVENLDNLTSMNGPIIDSKYLGISLIGKRSKIFHSIFGGYYRHFSKYKVTVLLEGGFDRYYKEEYIVNTIDVPGTPGDTSGRYRLDTFSNGQQRCRDTRNGQFVETKICTGTSAYSYEETIYEEHSFFNLRINSLVNYHFGKEENWDFIIGAGFVLSDVKMPIFSFGVVPKPTKEKGMSVIVLFGEDYLSVGGAYQFR